MGPCSAAKISNTPVRIPSQWLLARRVKSQSGLWANTKFYSDMKPGLCTDLIACLYGLRKWRKRSARILCDLDCVISHRLLRGILPPNDVGRNKKHIREEE